MDNNDYLYNQNTQGQDGNTAPASNQNPYSNNYGQSNYSQNSYGSDPYGNGYAQYTANPHLASKPPKQRREHKSGFGVKLAKCAAIALVFGLVGGGVFTGVSYAGTKALGLIPASGNAAAGQNVSAGTQNAAPVKQTSTGSAKDLLSVADIAEEAMPSIVAITNTSVVTYQSFFGTQRYKNESCGSGIIVDQDEDYLYILTNNHVVSDAEELSIQFCNEVSVAGETQGTYAANDLAVVKVAKKDVDADTLSAIRTITIGDSDELRVGEGTIAIGNALGYGQSVTTGVVSALDRSVTVEAETSSSGSLTVKGLIQTSAAINPGNSGGALLNAQGELIGINSAKYSNTSVEGIGYAIPINQAMKFFDSLVAGESVVRSQKAYLGIAGKDMSKEVASAYNLPVGAYVTDVYPGTGAERAGICKGDIITAIGKEKVTTMAEVQDILVDYAPGDIVTITIERMDNGYQSMEVDVELCDRETLEKASEKNN